MGFAVSRLSAAGPREVLEDIYEAASLCLLVGKKSRGEREEEGQTGKDQPKEDNFSDDPSFRRV